MNRTVAAVFAVIGGIAWHWPGYNGFFFPPSDISIGDSRIMSAIFLVGAAIVWFVRPPQKP
jgi:hypothetical protein